MNEHLLVGIVAMVGIAALSLWIAHGLKLPTIVVLLAVGLGLGPVGGVISPDALLGDLLFPSVSLGAALILFEGGLSARLSDLKNEQGALLRLVSVGLVLTWLLILGSAALLLSWPLEYAALLGAILVVTGPTVIGPLLRHARPTARVARILKFEGIINDPIGAVLAVLVFQVIQAEKLGSAVSMITWGVIKAALVGIFWGLVSAWLFVQARRRGWLPNSLQNPILLSLVLGTYAVSNHFQAESGLIAVTVMGMSLASQKKVDVEESLEFFEHMRTMLIAILFVLLTARIQRAQLYDLSWGAFGFVAALIFVVRPVAVLLSTIGTGLSLRERLFVAFLAPRGIVAAAVASVFSLRLDGEGQRLLSITFLCIAACVVVYGLSASKLVKLLHLEQPEPRGVLFVGANRIARMVAEALMKQKVRVLLVDPNRSKVTRARYLGLQAEHGRLLSDHVLNRLDLDDIGQLIALTPNEDENTLAVARFRSEFGQDRVHQVRTAEDSQKENVRYARELRGTTFAPELTFDELEQWALWSKAKVTPLSKEFDMSAYEKHHGTNALPLLILDEKGHVRLFSTEVSSPQPGEKIVSLVIDEDKTVRGPERPSRSAA